MKNSKQLIIGIIVGIVATLAVGAALEKGTNIGRYQVSAGLDLAVIVDTATGQSWTLALRDNNIHTSSPEFSMPKTGSDTNQTHEAAVRH
jgi:hypothetical protein